LLHAQSKAMSNKNKNMLKHLATLLLEISNNSLVRSYARVIPSFLFCPICFILQGLAVHIFAAAGISLQIVVRRRRRRKVGWVFLTLSWGQSFAFKWSGRDLASFFFFPFL
jgi:hypothetical protein